MDEEDVVSEDSGVEEEIVARFPRMVAYSSDIDFIAKEIVTEETTPVEAAPVATMALATIDKACDSMEESKSSESDDSDSDSDEEDDRDDSSGEGGDDEDAGGAENGRATGESNDLRAAGAKKKLQKWATAEEEDDEVPSGPVRSKNEVEREPVDSLTGSRVDSGRALGEVGKVIYRIDKESTVVVQASSTSAPLDVGALLCSANEVILGRVHDVFGPVAEPFYCVHWALAPREKWVEGACLTMEDMEDVKLDHVVKEGVFANGAPIFSPLDENSIVSPAMIGNMMSSRGCDASNLFDEELPLEQQEHSDDEAESVAKKAKKGGNDRVQGGGDGKGKSAFALAYSANATLQREARATATAPSPPKTMHGATGATAGAHAPHYMHHKAPAPLPVHAPTLTPGMNMLGGGVVYTQPDWAAMPGGAYAYPGMTHAVMAAPFGYPSVASSAGVTPGMYAAAPMYPYPAAGYVPGQAYGLPQAINHHHYQHQHQQQPPPPPPPPSSDGHGK